MTAQTLQTNTDFEDMGFDTESMDFLQDLLSEIYTMSEQSAIREYVANGLDATAMAGSDAPVEITTPRGFEQSLSITDHGVGMSPEAVRELFGRYGGSSKRGSAEEIGGFGIGSKAGFAVADMIHVVSVKDGVRTEMTAARASGGPKITAFTTSETDRTSGTTVTLPVDPTYDWDEAAYSAFCFARGRVSLNGETIADVRGDDPDEFSVIGRHPYRSGPLGRGDHRVVMGGPVYRLTDQMRSMVTDAVSGLNHSSLVVELDPKALAVAPNREYIKDNAANREAFADILDRWVSDMESQMLGHTPWQTWKKNKSTDSLDFAASVYPASVSQHLHDVSMVLSRTDFGPEPTLAVVFDGGPLVGDRKVFGRTNDHGRVIHGSAYTAVRDSRADRTVYIDVSDDDTLSRSPKISRWLADQGEGATVVLISDQREYAELSRAGLPTLTPEQMRKYKPVTGNPGPSQARQVRYAVSTIGTPDGGFNSAEMTGEEIGQHYDAVTFEHRHHVRFFNGPSAAKVFAEHHPGRRIGMVALTSQQKKEPALKRIGLEEVDVYGLVDTIQQYDIAALTENERTLLSAMSHLNEVFTLDDADDVRRRILRTEDRFGTNYLLHMRTVCRLADELAGEHDLPLPDDFITASRLIEQISDVSWIDRMCERLGRLQTSRSIQRAVATNDDPWGAAKDAMRLLTPLSPDSTEDQKAIVAGLMLRHGKG